MFKLQNVADTLCETCQWSTVARGRNKGEVSINCGKTGRMVNMLVTECNEHKDRGKATLRDYYEIAWVLRTSSAGRAIGFKPPVKDDDKRYWEVDDV